MPKPKTPNQKYKYSELNKRMAKYISLVQSIYETLNLEAAKLVESLGITEESLKDKPFSFADYPETKKKLSDIQKRFVRDIQAAIYNGTSEEWKNSNEVQDLLANSVLKAYDAIVDREKYKVLYQTNSDALKAFQNRKDKGFNISEKLWNQSVVYKKELEDAISCAIEKGYSAVTLSKRISKYLNDFPSLQKDYKERFGTASKAMDCEYRSLRLAASEINMAYRNAENERWKQMDFVVGFEIKLSGNHTLNGKPFRDICDELAGKYPKDFVWSGWHPLCRCYKIPILKTEEEFWEWDGRSEVSGDSVNSVNDVPEQFKKWVLNNEKRIKEASKRGTLPYFLFDNQSSYKKINIDNSIEEIIRKSSQVGEEVQNVAKKIADKYGGFVTPINFKSKASIARKITTDGINPYDIKDAVRTTIIVPKNNIEYVLNELSIMDIFLRKKIQSPESNLGYSGNIVNIKTSNGIVAEIQVNTEMMIYAKEKPENAKLILGAQKWGEIRRKTGMDGGLGHEYYEEWRILEKTSEKAIDIEKKSTEYYSHFQ
ncbi:MAG: hypothetical protein IAA73_07350 [Bacteroidetes bacterium]|uniref:Phage head morphogenesis domain-containing protein n=1 Tax=Candidatus Gallipaludibacter merdavium TaxID=2840839 RepID=A0A9D9N4M8_9BACT|nr:hypothetical protein [Candidatus Gallipaludibacter merdavium]